jgi:putative inorganic carbon (hco3(-)) transporter
MYSQSFPRLVPAALVAFLFVCLRDVHKLPHLLGPLTWPIGLLILMAAVGVHASPVVEPTSPKVVRFALGVAALKAVVVGVLSTRHFWRAVGLYVSAGAAVIAAGMLNVNWPMKFTALRRVAPSPSMSWLDLPGAQPGVNSNVLAAATLLFLPVLFAVIVVVWRSRQPSSPLASAAEAGSLRFRPVTLALLLALLLIFLGVLLISQSRTAWFSLLGTTITLWGLSRQWWRRLIAVTACVAIVAILIVGRNAPEPQVEAVTVVSGSVVLKAEQRFELWARAISAIHDFPWTGVGLGGFQQVIWAVYPPFLLPSQSEIPHVHNLLLQTALDVGIAGLIAYLAIVFVAAIMCWQIQCGPDRSIRTLGLGLGGSLLAINLFGFFDAMELGTRVGTFFWVALGILTAAHNLTRTAGGLGTIRLQGE